ncbi:MAG TPA: cytidine deaminase [Terrimicrobiaceae bacterium]|nr:cytidine deaminase [Terrimicrobiaceae bacterium]
MDFDALIQSALEVRQRAYAPYSHFSVGAALLAENGEVFLGCNVENLSFGLTLCAERSAVVAAVAAGQTRFQALAIVADTATPISPCGACRQVLAEFSPDLPIVLATVRGKRETYSLDELLPRAKAGILEKP